MGKENKMLRTAGFMAFATLLAKVLGLVRDSLIAAYFSTGIEADAYLTASKLPTMLFDMVIGGVITASFIPVFNSILEKRDKKQALKFANKFITAIFLISVIIAGFGIVFSDKLIYILGPGFNEQKHLLAAQLSAIMFPMIIFTGLAFSFVGLLQSFGEFNIPSIISLVSNLALIIYFPLFGNKYGVRGLAVTMVIAWSLQVLIQVPSLIKLKIRIRPDFRLKDSDLFTTMKLAGPMLISTWIQPLYSIINSRLASGIDGAPAVLELANRLYTVLVGVFSFVVTNLIFPKLARANASDNKEESKKIIVTSLKAIVLIVMPLMAGFMILSRPITSIIYEHNKFTADDVIQVSSALKCYAVGMVGLAINEILSKYFFSMQNSKTPMRNSVLSMFINVGLAYVFFNIFKTSGLALAAACGSIINAVLNGVSLTKHVNGLFSKKDLLSFGKMILSVAVMSVITLVLYNAAFPVLYGTIMGNIILVGICVAVAVPVYFIFCYFLRVDVFKDTIDNLLKKR